MKKNYLLPLFFCIHFACFGQKNAIVYKLPAPTVEKIDSLLLQRKPTYAGITFKSVDTLVVWFSFEEWDRIIPEYRQILRKTNRFLEIKEKRLPLFFVFDGIFYPKKRYNHTINKYRTLDVYIDDEGNYINSQDWDVGRLEK